MVFTEDIIQQVWEKADVVNEINPDGYRKDKCGAWIAREGYKNRDFHLGWEIDYITPHEKGGGNELTNLRPLHWENNLSKYNDKLKCVVKANGTKNVKQEL